MTRREKDFIGEEEIPEKALYGIHSYRAKSNFSNKSIFNLEWYKAVGVTKQAVYQVYKKFKSAALQKYPKQKLPIDFINDDIIDSLIDAAIEVSEGRFY